MHLSIGDSATALVKSTKSKQPAASWNRPRSSRELKSFVEERYSFLPSDLEVA
ncbi:MAG: hypothetical protein L0H38_03125 [bacterium]|nr:hypothetical protein [bacterium]